MIKKKATLILLPYVKRLHSSIGEINPMMDAIIESSLERTFENTGTTEFPIIVSINNFESEIFALKHWIYTHPVTQD